MRDFILFVGVDLGDGFCEVGDVKDGVVAEAVVALFFGGDLSFEGAGGFNEDFFRGCGAQAAYESCGSIFGGCIFHEFKNLFDVTVVDERSICFIGFVSGESCRVYSGGTIECVYDEAGVVGDGPQSGSVCIAGSFLASVFGEGFAIFFDLGDVREIRQTNPLNISIKHSRKFSHFSGVCSSYEYLSFHALTLIAV